MVHVGLPCCRPRPSKLGALSQMRCMITHSFHTEHWRLSAGKGPPLRKVRKLVRHMKLGMVMICVEKRVVHRSDRALQVNQVTPCCDTQVFEVQAGDFPIGVKSNRI